MYNMSLLKKSGSLRWWYPYKKTKSPIFSKLKIFTFFCNFILSSFTENYNFAEKKS